MNIFMRVMFFVGLSVAVQVKEINVPIGHNATVNFQVPGSIIAVNVTRLGQKDTYVYYHREGRPDSENQDPLFNTSKETKVWLKDCPNIKDCRSPSFILLIHNSSYYGTYNIYIKVKDENGKIIQKLIATVNIMPETGDKNVFFAFLVLVLPVLIIAVVCITRRGNPAGGVSY